MAIQMTSSHPDLLQPGWSSLSGRILEGGFEVQELLEAEGACARFKVRVLGDRDLDCVALLFQVEEEKAEQQVGLWSLTRQLRHPNVSAPLGAGRIVLDGVVTVYVVVRRADESLDDVLRERALTADEAGDALSSVARALEVLHLNDLVYGCLAPSRVLAVGESIQLPAECVRGVKVTPAVHVFSSAYLAPESEGENITPATDLWCLGATLFESLTQKAWTEASRDEAGALPEPFASIVLRCLHSDPEGRAGLGEVMALYRGELKPVPRVRAAVAGSSTTLIVPDAALSLGSEALMTSGPAALDRSADDSSAMEPVPIVLVPTGIKPEQISSDPKQSVPIVAEQPVSLSSAAAPANEQEPARLVASTPFLVRSPAEQAGARPSAQAKVSGQASSARPSFDEAIQDVSARRRNPELEKEEPATNLWIWAGLTVLVVLGLIWALRPKPATVQANSGTATAASHLDPSAATPSRSPNDASGAKAWETRTLQPDGSAVKAAPSGAKPSNSKPATVRPAQARSIDSKPVASKAGKTAAGVFSGASGEVWRVVASTYAHREDAERRVKAINAKHGNLHASIFSPSGSGSLFLVTLGDWMNREEAAQIRRKAVAAGMPRDTYIQNYIR